ncbi:MAG: tRNA threonylcarbamoyladenosine dehydratase [Candidatus Heteroscillospira sp.]
MQDQFIRTRMLLGDAGMEILKNAHVAVFGLGGVGGHAAEALTRSGVGALTLVDKDSVSLSNLNRQTIALHSTVGLPKTEAAARRLLDINPRLRLCLRQEFYTTDTEELFPLGDYDYVVDAVDTVTAKLLLVRRAKEAGVPVISCMGTGNKLDPTRLEVADLAQTSECPLARVMRRELGRLGIKHLKVVCSREKPLEPADCGETPDEGRRSIPGSTAFVPAAAGLILAGEVVRDLIRSEE